MTEFRIFVVFLIFFILLNSKTFAEQNDVANAVIKAPNAVLDLVTTPKNNFSTSLFAFSENDVILVRDFSDSKILYTLPVSETGKTGKLIFSQESNEEVILLSLSEDSFIRLWRIPSYVPSENSFGMNIQPEFSVKYPENLRITSVAFSLNSDYIAIADEKNQIGIYYKLRYSNSLILHTIPAHLKEIYSMDFSSNNKYLVSADVSGNIKIWDVKKEICISEQTFSAKNSVPVLWLSDSKNILCASDEKKLSIRNIEGNEILNFETSGKILDVKLLPEKNLLAVLTDQNLIHFYSLEDGKHIGYLPPYNLTSITSFTPDCSNEFILAGYEDGSIYKINIKKEMLEPDEKYEPVKFILESEIINKGSTHQDELTDDEIQEAQKQYEENARQIVVTLEENSVDIFAGAGAFFTGDFIVSANLDASFKCYSLLQPFYFGGGGQISYGFPKRNFPYEYSYENTVLSSPNLISASLYVPFGFKIKTARKNFAFYAEGRCGIKTVMIVNFLNKTKSNTFFSPFGGISLGFSLNRFNLQLSVEYDTILQFTPNLMIGYSIRIPQNKKNKVSK